MSDPQMNPNVQKAVAFFTSAGLSRLFAKLRAKYIELGQVGGQVLLEDATPGERREIASFLGKPPYRETNFRVKLVDMDNALRQSGFTCTLPEVLQAFFPDSPLVTRQEQRAAHSVQQAHFRTALFSIGEELPEESRGRSWLQRGSHGQEWLFSRYKNAPVEEQERQLKLVRYIARVLDSLPQPGASERLALFAQRTSGDPHTLDPNQAAGRLLLLALNDLAKETGTTAAGMTPARGAPTMTVDSDTRLLENRANALRLYANAGLLVDTISSSVAVFNLAGANYTGGRSDPLIQAAGKRVLLLPLRQLQEWEYVQAAGPDIYVFENPQVFEAVISALDLARPLPTLICTSGWPSVAAMMLLDLLIAQSSDTTLHYSGDFDVKGLQIAAHLMARYPGRCHLWRFDPDSYTSALQVDGILASANELNMLNALPDVFASLVTLMQEKKKWAYQEGITHLLSADLNRGGLEGGQER